MPSKNMPIQRLNLAVLPLDISSSGFLTRSEEILTPAKSHKKKPDGSKVYNGVNRYLVLPVGLFRKDYLDYLHVSWRSSPPVGHSLLIHDISRSHTTTHHSRQGSSGRVISPSQRFLRDNTQDSQQTDIHTAGGIRTHNLSRRATADPRLIIRIVDDIFFVSKALELPSIGDCVKEFRSIAIILYVENDW